MDIKDKAIIEKIAALEKERDAFVAQANLQLAAYNGAIQALKDLLDPAQPGENGKALQAEEEIEQ